MMTSRDTYPIVTWKIAGHDIRQKPDLLAPESLLTLYVNGKKAHQFLYLPKLEIELCLGFLLTSGVLETMAEVLEMRLLPPDWHAGRDWGEVWIRLAKPADLKNNFSSHHALAILTGEGGINDNLTARQFRRSQESPVQVPVSKIKALMAALPHHQEIFRQTGATHAICLAAADGDGILLSAEDVGRHNAFDKVIGQALMKNLPTASTIALLSGRASFEMVFKAARAGLPILSSVSAPTSLAVRLAELQGITLIGFARGEHLNVYTHPHRLAELAPRAAV
ncbi:formate dehydrogenase accessory sulfurtransferase FdhD [Desulfobacca acetoxidans]|nr:formate dehydrogenase accessory sulfurtransferase FdhD [Desulfobacca acetoxidans]